jgi:hypothetical protein
VNLRDVRSSMDHFFAILAIFDSSARITWDRVFLNHRLQRAV